jgi:hypothetical protein
MPIGCNTQLNIGQVTFHGVAEDDSGGNQSILMQWESSDTELASQLTQASLILISCDTVQIFKCQEIKSQI